MTSRWWTTGGAVTLLALLVFLEGCALRETFGIGKTSPDALRVIKQDPLAVPPNLDLVPPGEAGATGTGTGIVPVDPAEGAASEAEAALLAAAGTRSDDPDIREQLEREQQAAASREDDASFIDRAVDVLLFWQDDDDSPSLEAEAAPLEEETRPAERAVEEQPETVDVPLEPEGEDPEDDPDTREQLEREQQAAPLEEETRPAERVVEEQPETVDEPLEPEGEDPEDDSGFFGRLIDNLMFWDDDEVSSPGSPDNGESTDLAP